MRRLFLLLFVPPLFLGGCGPQQAQPQASSAPAPGDGTPDKKRSLLEERRGFQTKLIRKQAENEPVPDPPPQLFRTVHYESPAGRLAAYLSPSPSDGKKHPAIIWVFGGFANSIGETAWEPAPAKNDQSASAFRKAGIMMMYPSLRGGNDNPGFKEGFFGEVDDLLAATEYLARQDFVDPQRVYLGGHSTGGTLVLLVAACTDRFRGVFSFGPVSDVAGYGSENIPFDLSDRRELELRSPERWINSVQSPTFVFEGAGGRGNLDSLKELSRASRNPLTHFHPVKGADHFSILAPLTKVIAAKVVRDEGPTTNIAFTEKELNDLLGR